MNKSSSVIASGNLASSRRTITGVLGQLPLMNVSAEDAVAIFTNAGLPTRALQEPDFPISLQQELRVCSAIVSSLAGRYSPLVAVCAARHRTGIEGLGVLGMAMRHADTALEALKVCVSFPQLSWGHSRLIVYREGDVSRFTFTMERPVLRDTTAEQVDRLVEYCLALDLVSSMRNIEDILDQREPPLYIRFAFPEPPDWQDFADKPGCQIQFSAQETCLAYSTSLQEQPLPRANPVVYRSFVSIAKKLALMLGEDSSLTERVTRWLWAYTPPLRRGEIAQQLAISERSLTRQLRKEGSSYADLLGQVQRERAENFLRNEALSVSEIAYRLGYSEPAAFSRAFVGWTGLPPLKWRQRNRAQYGGRSQ